MRCDDDDSEDSPGPSGSSEVDMDTDGNVSVFLKPLLSTIFWEYTQGWSLVSVLCCATQVFQPLQHCSLLREGMVSDRASNGRPQGAMVCYAASSKIHET